MFLSTLIEQILPHHQIRKALLLVYKYFFFKQFIIRHSLTFLFSPFIVLSQYIKTSVKKIMKNYKYLYKNSNGFFSLKI